MATILIVDDESSILDLCVRILQELDGCNILRASNGIEALKLARRHKGQIDLLLSDIVMDGGTNGLELAETFCASRPAMKVLLMSAYFTEDPTLKQGWHFITKPFMPAALKKKIQEVLDGP